MRGNIDKLRDGQHVVVGTPGRVFDMLSKRHLRIDELLTFVCDETDVMLSRGFEDPASNGEYRGTCVSTAPVTEPTVMLFTMPLSDSIIAATATAMTTCLSSADCSDSAVAMCSVNVCVAMPCGGGSFTPDGAYEFSFGQHEADERKTHHQLLPVPRGRRMRVRTEWLSK